MSIRNAIGIIKEFVAFFNASTKRDYVLAKVLKAQLMGFGKTRLIERQESLIQFVSELPKIIQSLEHISHWSESTTTPKAKTLVTALHSAKFVVSLQCLHSICALTLPLSRLFQKRTMDLGAVYGHVSNLLDVLAKRRETCDEEFALVFEQVKELSDKIQLAVKVPRTAQSKVHRNNSPHTTPEVYYRHVVFIPMLDSVISD